MDNEATKILFPEQNATQGQPAVNNLPEEKKEGNATPKKEDKGSTFFARTAATAAGAALGTSAAMAAEHIIEASTDAPDEVEAAMANEEQVQAVAAETEPAPQQESEVVQETATVTTATTTAQVQEAASATVPPVQETVAQQASATAQTTGTTPDEHDAIVATDEGLRVAQVDDSLSFSQAFAEARSQVGAGGVFEWNGKVYSTYYAEEWDGMSASERSDWQARVDYGDVIDASEPSSNATSFASQNDNLMAEAEIAPDSTYIDNSAEPQVAAQVVDDNEVHVVGVAVQDNGQGGVATLAGLQSGDEMAILVDVDTDGTIDLLVSDANADGQLGADEVYDISDHEIATGDVVGAYVEEAHMHGATAVVTDVDSGDQYQITETSNGYGLAPMDDTGVDDNMYMASNDDMPDYMNDADAGFMDA